MTFKRQSRFDTRNPEDLARQLRALEDAVAQAFVDVEASTYPRGSVVRVNSGETVSALIGNYYVCDTNNGNIVLVLEDPQPKHANSFLIVDKPVSANSVTLKPNNSTINGSATGLALTAASAYFIPCDGTRYRREF